MPSVPFDTSGGPRLQTYQPFNRPTVLRESIPERTTQIYVKGVKEALQLQYDIARGVKEPFLATYSNHINVIASTVRGEYAIYIVYQRPESGADYEPMPEPGAGGPAL